jgi:hypothetical protein
MTPLSDRLFALATSLTPISPSELLAIARRVRRLELAWNDAVVESELAELRAVPVDFVGGVVVAFPGRPF